MSAVARLGIALEQRDGRHDLARLAIAALRRRPPRSRPAAPRADRPAPSPSMVVTRRPASAETGSRQERSGAPSTCTVQAPQKPRAAAELGAGQACMVAQVPQQRHLAVAGEFPIGAIDCEADAHAGSILAHCPGPDPRLGLPSPRLGAGRWPQETTSSRSPRTGRNSGRYGLGAPSSGSFNDAWPKKYFHPSGVRT